MPRTTVFAGEGGVLLRVGWDTLFANWGLVVRMVLMLRCWRSACWIMAASCLRFRTIWPSSASILSVVFGSCWILVRRRVRISASLGDWRPHMKIRHLNWSSVGELSWKRLHSLFTIPAYVMKSSESRLQSWRHCYRVLSRDDCSPKIWVKIITVSTNETSLGFFGRMKLA